MAAIDSAAVQSFVDKGKAAKTTTDRGRALEDMVCYVFEQVPGISITMRNEKNTFQTEEIDVALWNDGPEDGFFFFENIILVECKNWSVKVGSEEVSWFDTKLRHRGLSHGILVSVEGITGDEQSLGQAHSIISRALEDKRKLIIITVAELLKLTSSDDLLKLVKYKLCQLAVAGTLN